MTSYLIYNKIHVPYQDLKARVGPAPGHLSHFTLSFSPPLLIVLLTPASFLCSEIVDPYFLRSCVHTLSSVWRALYFYLFNKSSDRPYYVSGLFLKEL